MKKFFIAGPVLLILMVGTFVILLTSTNLLLPEKFKNRETRNPQQNEYVEHPDHVVDDGYSRSFEQPLFNDEMDLSYLTISELATYKNMQICFIKGKADLDGKKICYPEQCT